MSNGIGLFLTDCKTTGIIPISIFASPVLLLLQPPKNNARLLCVLVGYKPVYLVLIDCREEKTGQEHSPVAATVNLLFPPDRAFFLVLSRSLRPRTSACCLLPADVCRRDVAILELNPFKPIALNRCKAPGRANSARVCTSFWAATRTKSCGRLTYESDIA